MKKLLRILPLCFLLGIVSCGSDDNDDSASTPQREETPTNENANCDASFDPRLELDCTTLSETEAKNLVRTNLRSKNYDFGADANSPVQVNLFTTCIEGIPEEGPFPSEITVRVNRDGQEANYEGVSESTTSWEDADRSALRNALSKVPECN